MVDAVNTSAESESRAQRSASRAAVILGNDAVVAARPCSVAQLAHACTAAGFDIVVPPSWGDELVAAGYLDQLGSCRDVVVAACACARVTALLGRAPTPAPARHIAVAAPPVAAARYLRLVYGEALLVTYVGDCPSATDAEIDAQFTPVGFFASLHRQGVFINAQPMEMDEDAANKWRRHLSIPGGLPARRFLARAPVDRLLREVDIAHAAEQQWRATRANVILDLAEAAGCACGGNRAWVEESELPRSSMPILVAPPGLSLRPDPSSPRARPAARAGVGRATSVAGTDEAERLRAPDPAPNDVEPPAIQNPPEASAASPTPTPAVEAIATSAPPVRRLPPPTAPSPSASARRATRAAPHPPPQPSAARRSVTLIVVPAIVLAVTGALGMAVYATTTSAFRSNPRTQPERSTTAPDTTARAQVADDVRPLPDTAPAQSPLTSNGTTATAPVGADSLARIAAPGDSSNASADSLAAQVARRRLRDRAPEIVPGWLPQGQKWFTPVDSASRRKRDSSSTKPPAPPDTIPRA